MGCTSPETSLTIQDISVSADFSYGPYPDNYYTGNYQFDNHSLDASSYEWDFGDGNTSVDVHPNNLYLDPGNYIITLIATDEKGCKDTIQKPIIIIEEYYIYVPNTFTPDDSRINDEFFVKTINITELKIDVYNRWGEKVYTSNNVNFRWDGTYKGENVPDGTYTYKVSYLARNGTEGKLVGHLNILR